MLCEICKRKEATFFIKEQVFGETKTHSLCEDCAKKHKETLMPSNIQIEKLIKSLLDFTEEENEVPKKKVTKKQKMKKCNTCGSTFDEVILAGVAGCADCYKTFKSDIDELILRNNKLVTYEGTAPKSIKKKSSTTKNKKLETEITIREYKVELNNAIKNEDFEKAAKLRDLIKELENKNDKETKKVSTSKTKKETKSTSKKSSSTKKTVTKKETTTKKVKKNGNSK
ncbi:MAG: UvrB/UvrC motif-containing protein [Clostridia bacterium]|nr:UvrB/UvrC motif-containing protein [Clostridia bacterium]